MTNREMFVQIKEKLTDPEEIFFIESQIAALDRKKAKSQERRAEQKKAGDELREAIYDALTDEFQTLPQIVKAVSEATGIEDFSTSKAIPRLKALCELERVVKEKVKTDSGEKMAYKLA